MDNGAYSGWKGTSANLFYDYSDKGVPKTTVTAATADNINEIVWRNLGSSGTIAMTTVWYNRYTKAIVEFDMEFNNHYDWSAQNTGISEHMDLQNIATHELGHSVGLADLYKSTATQETMYGYSDFAVITARVLCCGDKAGITSLYG